MKPAANSPSLPPVNQNRPFPIILGLLLAFLLGMGTMYGWQNYPNLKIPKLISPSPSPSEHLPFMYPDTETLRKWKKAYEEAPIAATFNPEIVLNFIKENHPETTSLIDEIPSSKEGFPYSPFCDTKRTEESPRRVSYICGSWIVTYVLDTNHTPFKLKVDYKERVVNCDRQSCSCPGESLISWTGIMKKYDAEIPETSYMNKIKN